MAAPRSVAVRELVPVADGSDIADDGDGFVRDAVDRLDRMRTVRPGSHVIAIQADTTPDEIGARLRTILLTARGTHQ